MGFSRNYFVEEKPCGPSPRIGGPCRPGPPWTGGHCRTQELTEAQPLAILVPESSDQGAGQGEESIGVPILGSPGIERRPSGSATTVKAAVEERSVRAHSGHRERGRRGGGGVVGGADAGVPFYRVRGGVGQPGVREERVAAVVHHNGDDGGSFGRGSAEE
jgi:hypothetical protein